MERHIITMGQLKSWKGRTISSVNDIKVLGFDVSYRRTAWALLNGMEYVEHGVIELGDEYKKVTFKDAKFSQAISAISATTEMVCKSLKPDFVVLEDMNIRFLNSGKVLMQAGAAVKVGIVRANSNQVIHLINNKTIKSFFGIPSRNKDFPKDVVSLSNNINIPPWKIMIVDIVNEMYDLNFNYEENDEADAISLALTEVRNLGIQIQKGEL